MSDTETKAAFRQAEIRLDHVERLLTLVQNELRNVPLIAGDWGREIRQLLEIKRTVTEAGDTAREWAR